MTTNDVSEDAVNEGVEPHLDIAHDSLKFRFGYHDPSDHIVSTMRSSATFYEVGLLRALQNFDYRGRWVIDVGANIGNHSVFFAGVMGLRTLALEPNPSACSLLKMNVTLNGLDETIKVLNKSAWSHQTVGTMKVAEDGNLGTAMFIESADGEFEATTLDSIGADKDIAIIKIDVEGNEGKVLAGSMQIIHRCRPVVIVECDDPASRTDIELRLRELGYSNLARFNATPTYVFITQEHKSDLFANDAAIKRLFSLERSLAKSETEIRSRDETIIGLNDDLEKNKYKASRHRQKVKTLMAHREKTVVGWLRQSLARLKFMRGLRYEAFEEYDVRVTNASRGITQHYGIGRQEREDIVFLSDTDRWSDPIVARVASFPPRQDNLRLTVRSLLHQVDELHVYLNDYAEIPSFLRSPKIKVTLSRNSAGDLRDNGKIFGLTELSNKFILLCDDDLVYPPNYAETMRNSVIRYGFRCVVGVHGTIYTKPARSYIKDREVIHFRDASDDVAVDQLGSGTAAFHTSMKPIRFSDAKSTGVLDLWLAKSAHQNGLPMIAIRRPKAWIKPLPNVGASIFADVKQDDTTESKLLADELLPVLMRGTRAKLARHLSSIYETKGICSLGLKSVATIHGTTALECLPDDKLEFEILVSGWNCQDKVESCLSSIFGQSPGKYKFSVSCYDDGSTDGTFEKLKSLAEKYTFSLLRSPHNKGPAFARNELIRSVNNAQAICVLVDMDDELLPNALDKVSAAYLQNPDCLITYGDWINQRGERNTEGGYSSKELADGTYASNEKFLFTHLRTFKRHLYDAVNDDDLQDSDGNWLKYCTDVALMFALARTCQADSIVYIDDPVYLYNQYRGSGTQLRFGGDAKKEMFSYLKEKNLRKTNAMACSI